jgi:hypothetical protein
MVEQSVCPRAFKAHARKEKYYEPSLVIGQVLQVMRINLILKADA